MRRACPCRAHFSTVGESIGRIFDADRARSNLPRVLWVSARFRRGLLVRGGQIRGRMTFRKSQVGQGDRVRMYEATYTCFFVAMWRRLWTRREWSATSFLDESREPNSSAGPFETPPGSAAGISTVPLAPASHQLPD